MPHSYATLTNASAVSNANSVSNGTFTLIGQYDLTAAPPDEVLIDAKLVPSTTPSSTNKQSVLYVASSQDGTTWSDAPSSTTASNSRYLGRIDQPDSTGRQPASMPVSPLFAMGLPRYLRIYTYNDLGVAYASSGHTLVATAETL